VLGRFYCLGIVALKLRDNGDVLETLLEKSCPTDHGLCFKRYSCTNDAIAYSLKSLLELVPMEVARRSY